MTQYNPATRYDVIHPDGSKVGEVVKGILYEGAPDYRQEVGAISAVGDDLTLVINDVTFQLVPQA